MSEEVPHCTFYEANTELKNFQFIAIASDMATWFRRNSLLSIV